MWPNPQKNADLVTFTEEILNGELHSLCSETWKVLGSFMVFKDFGNYGYQHLWKS